MRAMNKPSETIDAADQRLATGIAWAEAELGVSMPEVQTVAGDASFRRYLRLGDGSGSWILMDAPPEKETSDSFVDITHRLREAGLHAPRLEAVDLQQGYLLLEDLGDQLFRDLLDTDSAERWFPELFDVLARFAGDVDTGGLPGYSRKRLQDELELFPTWYLRKHKGLEPDCAFFDYWESLCTDLMVSAETQPQVFVHRDFHSCNLLLTADQTIGIIDYQDAVCGPLSYDLASLLWDRYEPWPRKRLERWMELFRLQVAAATPEDVWQRQVDWMGLQRNLKIVGIFARLHYRDGKAGYLEMIPRFWNYLMDVLPRYPRFDPFLEQLEQLQCAP